MTDVIQEVENNTSKPKDISKDTDKSKRQAAPVYPLIEIVAFCSRIYTELGFGAYHSKELIAQANGVVYDTIKQKLSTAQLYGTLELKHGTGYKLTNQFLKIHKPETQEEKREGVIECLRTPEIYSKLIDEINGHPLPSEQGLTARLIRNFGIKDYAAGKIAQVFLSNLKDNGLVGIDNVFKITVSTQEENGTGNNPLSTFEPKKPEFKEQPLPGFIEIPVPLKGGKRAYIKIPEDYTSEDCERIAKFVEALK